MLGILSFTTEVSLWTLTAIAFIALLVFWNKFTGRNLRKILARIAILILIQVLAFSAVGVTLNRNNQFYDTWGDFLGFKKNLAKVATQIDSLNSISSVDIKNAKRTPNGSLIFSKIITGKYSKISDHVFVVLSPKLASQIESPNHILGSNYQVVEMFPGYPGVPETWIGALHGIETMELMEIAGQIPPTIAIIPAINVMPGLDTECLNIPGSAQVETWLTKDMQLFAQKFIGIDSRKWSTFGYSTGGWCAAQISIRHQDQYSKAISISGYFSPSFAAGINKRERRVLTAEYDLVKLLNSQDNSLELLIIYAKSDRSSVASMNSFTSKIGNSLNYKTVEILSGGHNIKVWRPYVRIGFQWLANGQTPL